MKTASLNPSAIILDLEDSVQQWEKQGLRKIYTEALKDKILGKSIRVFIRTSPLENRSELCNDLETFIGSGINGFCLPKIENPQSIAEVDSLIGNIEKEKGITTPYMHKLIPLIETPAAYFNVDKIATASKRNIALVAGSGDFTAEMICNDGSLAYDAFFSQVVLAARAAGLGALWGVHDKIDDLIGFEKVCTKMKNTGFNGAAVLTPKQIALANYIFSLTPKQNKWVESVLSRNSDGNNIKVVRPSVQESRQMIGPPHRIKAENTKSVYQPFATDQIESVKGFIPSKGMPSNASIGEAIYTPIRLMVGESWNTLWSCAFPPGNGLSRLSHAMMTPQQLPFSLATTMAVALTVSTLSYHARVHLGFRNIFQHRALLAGDVIQAMYKIDSVVPKKGGDGCLYSIVTSTHWLVNQANKVILQLEKTTMFSPNDSNLQSMEAEHLKSLAAYDSWLLKEILQCPADVLLPSQSQPELKSGMLVIHDFVKVMGHSETRMLCNLLNIVNPHHHNSVRYSATDLLVPGPFVMSAGISNTALDLGEVLYEDIPLCINPNKVNFGDQLGTMTYVVQSEVINEGNYERIALKHIVVKNVDMEILSNFPISIELLEGIEKMKPSKIEALCTRVCPILLNKIVCVIVRRIVRVPHGRMTTRTLIPKELLA